MQRFSKTLPLELQKQDAETVTAWMQRLAELVDDDEQAAFKRLALWYQRYIYAVDSQPVSESLFFDLLKTCADALKKRRKDLS